MQNKGPKTHNRIHPHEIVEHQEQKKILKASAEKGNNLPMREQVGITFLC